MTVLSEYVQECVRRRWKDDSKAKIEMKWKREEEWNKNDEKEPFKSEMSSKLRKLGNKIAINSAESDRNVTVI